MNSFKAIEKKYHDGYYWNDNRKYFIVEVDKTPIGEVVLHKALNYPTAGLELAICLDEQAYRNNGVGKRIVCLLNNYIFNNMSDINRVQAVIDSKNEPSINLFKSCSFACEGTLRGLNFHHGEYRDALMYSILRREWEQTYRARC